MLCSTYSRFSPRKDADESESIEYQQEFIRDWCAKNDRKIDREFKDEDLTGSEMESRDDFLRAIEHCKATRQELVAYSHNRIARNIRDALNVEFDLRMAGARLVMLDIASDLKTREGKMVFTVKAMLSEFMLDDLRRATSDAMKRKQHQGLLVSGNPPYGFQVRVESQYTAKGEELIRLLDPAPAEQAVLGEIYKMEKMGYSPAVIRKALTDLGETFRGTTWRTRMVANILRRRLDIVPPGPVWNAGSPLQAESLADA